ncbi:MAG: site-specific DNA-methyltransferase [Holophagaceae bacterium]|nr:site-specific DNA-methyltransferase [Holophagaceae bacterium]
MATGIQKTRWSGELFPDGVLLPFSKKLMNRTELHYHGKKSVQEIFDGSVADTEIIWKSNSLDANLNTLFWGNNIEILRKLIKDDSVCKKVRLIYIDPPYATNSVFQSTQQSDAYQDLLQGPYYLEFIRERLVLLRELLADDGSIYIHLDDNMAFEVKILLDEVFGKQNFRNWITRRKCSTKNTTKNQYGNVSDYVMFYTKGPEYVWNRPVDLWTDEKIVKEYPCVDPLNGRRYKKVPIHAPGTRNGETGQPWRGMLPPRGKHWQYTPIRLDEMDANGEIYWSPSNNPRRKIYFDPESGIPKQDIWLEYRDSINQNVKVTGYPTEKNLCMLELIVQASSNPGDLVLDCFCGSGTTLYAAYLHERNWIGIDNSFEAICCTLKRFHLGTHSMGDYVKPNQKEHFTFELLDPSHFSPSLFPPCPLTLEVQEEFTSIAEEKLFHVH